MNKFRLVILTSSVGLLAAASSSALAQVPPIYTPINPHAKVCWQTTHIDNGQRVEQSACSTPLHSPNETTTPTNNTTVVPTPTPTPTITPTTPIEVEKQDQSLQNLQRFNREQSNNDQSGDRKEVGRSDARLIGELMLPALSVINELFD